MGTLASLLHYGICQRKVAFTILRITRRKMVVVLLSFRIKTTTLLREVRPLWNLKLNRLLSNGHHMTSLVTTSIAPYMVSWYFTKLETRNFPNHSTKLFKIVFPSWENELNKIWLKNSSGFVNINHIITIRNYLGLRISDICLKNSKACQNVW